MARLAGQQTGIPLYDSEDIDIPDFPTTDIGMTYRSSHPLKVDTIPQTDCISPVHDQLVIGPGEIRLLRLHQPPAHQSSSVVAATLFTARLDDLSLQYDALSYMWGDVNDRRDIEVNGQTLSVTRNLHSALDHLRHSSSSSSSSSSGGGGGGEAEAEAEVEPVVIWADSVCINQNNAEEKRTQVMSMDRIFSRAARVRIWLGPSSSDSALAMGLINDCGAMADEESVVARIAGDEAGALALARLLTRPYWSRMWMFQEIVLSRRASVHCGRASADWSAVKRMDVVAADWDWDSSGRPGESGGWVLDLRRAFANISQFTIPPGHLGDLESVLSPCRRLQSTDARDKLFALMGVCDLGAYLTVDYTKSTVDTYVGFTRNYFRQTGELTLLHGAGPWNDLNGPDLGLPSWTPDFRGMYGASWTLIGAGHADVFDASKGRRFSGSVSGGESSGDADGVLLEVEGLIVDAIRTAAPFSTDEADRRTVFEQFAASGMTGGSQPKPQPEDLCEALVFAHDGAGGGEANADAGSSGRMLGFIRDAEVLHPSFPRNRAEPNVAAFLGHHHSGDKKPVVVVESYLTLWRTDPAALDRHRAAYIREVERVTGESLGFFLTSKHVGRGTSAVRTGDVVAVLFGSRLPVVLRRCGAGSRFQFVGPCYVSGLMFGEAVDELDAGEDAADLKIARISLV